MKKRLLIVGAFGTLLFFSACGGSNGNGSDTSTGSRSDTGQYSAQTGDSTNSVMRPDTTKLTGPDETGTGSSGRPENQ